MSKKYSKEEKREYFRKQMEELKEGIEDKITDFLENSEELKSFISFRRKHFKNYSINNTLLIYRQMPEASYVAGFWKWQELGYKVKKGSKSISILIPMIRKDEEEKDKIYGFKKGSVFDVSQVEATKGAQELPSIDTSIKATKDTVFSPVRLLDSTKEYIEQFCPIITDRELGTALGATDGKNIYLKITNNRVDMTGVLIHEFAHYHNHFGDNRKELTKNQKESEAELTTLIFGSFFNLNIEGAYKYLSMYRKDRNLAECFEKAYSTFISILDGFEGKRGLEWILKGQES
ncbi:hypothetical protein PM10SUCC1_33030 [Propionigenium maris DSM 9537]|uniref:N-terminal domain-containing protein n=1 Tax=Propionigenium maris DSM 9537 TaxID=1123000 RepID=A0A9W6GMG7_9FUSO|nr:ArdC family protein [Propionigenium maris]GLI57789.1 hypothetical protein PM10SUCC1_33030 [Propionigenium maris DSM 9537]